MTREGLSEVAVRKRGCFTAASSCLVEAAYLLPWNTKHWVRGLPPPTDKTVMLKKKTTTENQLQISSVMVISSGMLAATSQCNTAKILSHFCFIENLRSRLSEQVLSQRTAVYETSVSI